MECTPGVAAPATAPLVVSPQSLLAAFARVPDPRRQASMALDTSRTVDSRCQVGLRRSW